MQRSILNCLFSLISKGLKAMRLALWQTPLFLPRARMRDGVKQLVLSVCKFVSLFVSQSGEKILNLNIDRVKQFPNLTVALTL